VTLRSYLTVLALAALLPVAVFATLVAYLLVEHQRDSFSQAAQARALSFLTAVDSELDSSVSAVRAIAAAPSAGEGNLERFQRLALTALESQPSWIAIRLSSPEGAPLVDMPQGAAGATMGPEGAITRALRDRSAEVGNLEFHPALKRWIFPVHAPVVREGKVKYLLTASVRAESINAIITAQRLPAQWGAVIVDGNNRFVARNWESEKFVGKLASQSLRDALASSASGWFRGRTVEGVEVYSPYWRSERTGWAVSMGYPASEVNAGAERALWLLGAGLLFALAIALALAHIISRRIATPIASLSVATDAIAHGVPVTTGTSTDIVEVRKLAAAMQAASTAVGERAALLEREKQALASADRAKDEFLAMLSHELRNPLAALSSAAHVLKLADPLSDAANKARRVVERQTKHMSRLVGDLLDVSRITVGKLALDRERFDLGEAVGRLANVWRASGRFERHEVSLETTPVWVDADRARVEQIVANLLDNALKFTPASKAVRLSVTKEDGAAVLRVADQGRGVSAEAAHRVFDLFVQEGHGGAGLGIGLALVKQLTEMHGGLVSVASADGGGSVFTVRLPSVPQPAAQEPVASGPRGARSVLIVEDNDDARQMLAAALALDGHEVRVARDGARGLALAGEARPDIALIDVGLPDMDGYEVARRLRAAHNGQRISLVALTGFGQPDDQRRALEAGFDAHLVKPVSAERLKRVFSELQ
jgi:signal transduction histidine kinase/CheY-like chemotaxis protein